MGLQNFHPRWADGLWREKAKMFPGHVESEISVDKFSHRFLNVLLRLPGTEKNGAQDEHGSGHQGLSKGT